MIFKALFGKKDAAPADVGGNKELLTLSKKLPVPADRAFAVFVDEIDRWWPRDYTWGKDKLDTIGIEARYGGHCFERLKDGSTTIWGTVLTVDRPKHIVFAWQITAERTPEASESTSSRVDVRFVDAGDGTSEMLLVHRDFFRHGENFEAYRNQMASAKGWPMLVDSYLAAVTVK